MRWLDGITHATDLNLGKLWEMVRDRDFPGGSKVKASASNAGDPGLIPGSGRYLGEGNGNPLQYSFLPGESQGQRSLVGYSPWGRKESDTTEQLHFHFTRDREAWRAAVAESDVTGQLNNHGTTGEVPSPIFKHRMHTRDTSNTTESFYTRYRISFSSQPQGLPRCMTLNLRPCIYKTGLLIPT